MGKNNLYPMFFSSLKKYNLDLNNVDLEEMYCKKYSYISYDEHVELYKENKLLTKGSPSSIQDLLLIYLFIDKYGDKKNPLPRFNNEGYLNAEHSNIVLKTLLKPVKTYNECINLIDRTDDKLLPIYKEFSEWYKNEYGDKSIKLESGEFIYVAKENEKYINIYGNKFSDFGTTGRYIEKVNNNEWNVYCMKDRSNDLKYLFTICDEECLYRYMLNFAVRSIR